MRHPGLPLLLALIIPLAAEGQQPGTPDPGARVRVTVAADEGRPTRIVGTLVALTRDEITLRSPADDGLEFRVPRISVTQVEVSQGQRTRWLRGLGLGFLGGAAAGAVFGFVLDEDGNDLRPEHAAAAGAVFGGIAGGLIGTVAGATTRVDRWCALPLTSESRVSISTMRRGRAVSVQLTF
jgi:hypothetical protein